MFCGGLLRCRMFTAKDISKLLADVPKGAWVALSNDEERVVAYASELEEALEKAREAGESDPVVTRVPKDGASSLIL
jgi:Family of unknown function (DUF5678)